MGTVKKASIMLALKHGACNTTDDFYGGYLVGPRNETVEALRNIREHDVDYENSSELRHDTFFEFNDTFSDPLEKTSVSVDIACNNGEVYTFAFAVGRYGITGLINSMVEISDASIEEVVVARLDEIYRMNRIVAELD